MDMLRKMVSNNFPGPSACFPHRQGGLTAASRVWGDIIGESILGMGIGPDISLIYDDHVLALSRPAPDYEWYTSLLAIRDSLLNYWLKHPMNHTKCCTIFLAIICIVLALAELRLLAIRDGAGRRTAMALTASLDAP